MKLKLLFLFLLTIYGVGFSQTFSIKYNQIGYFGNRSKVISITSGSNFSPQAFTVRDSGNNSVLTGTTGTVNLWTDGQLYVSKIDVSSITIAGTYTLQVAGLETEFTIGDDVYESLSDASLKYYYYNRASTSISSTYGGAYARSFGHPDTSVRVHSSAASQERPTGTIISAPKGWYDAGDYNKYIVNSGISTYTLLAAFEHYQSYYLQKAIDFPEAGGNLPDLLDEVKWNLDWMLAMQEPSDGGVYHKLTGLNFSGRIMPHQYTATRYVIRKSTAAALNFAAVLAVASRVYQQYDVSYSTTLIEAAEAAYAWAEANPTAYFTNPSDVRTGEYGDNNVTDEFQWAAVELFITTGNASYASDINVSSIGGGTPFWQYTNPLALISILHHSDAFPSGDVNTARNTFLGTVNSIKTNVESSVMNISMSSNNYVWGSNSVAANQILLLIRAYELTDDASFLDAAYVGMDYLFGRNGTGFSYVTGFGAMSSQNPHHRISDADNVNAPIPGMLTGGPNPGQQDNCTGYINDSNAGSYYDDWCSYASNEVTINWNAPLAYTVNALNFYQNGVALSVSDFDASTANVSVYPNPSQGNFNIKTTKGISAVEVYSTLGKMVYKGKTSAISLPNIPEGLYLLKITTSDRKVITKKVVKR